MIFGGLFSTHLSAQDTTAVDRVRLGIMYQPGLRPRIIILPAPEGYDSARAIIARDLDYSDRFEIVLIPDEGITPGLATGLTEFTDRPGEINYDLYRALNAGYAIELAAASSGMATILRVHDLTARKTRNDTTVTLDLSGVGDGRMGWHRLSDRVVGWLTGQTGVAATRIVYQERGSQRVYRVDSDGYSVAAISPGGQTSLSPTWSPAGDRIAYSVLEESGQAPIMIHNLSNGARQPVPTIGSGGTHITPEFSPDGRWLAYARITADGTALFRSDVTRMCCAERLTGGRFAADLSPTFSPDGRRIAFVSDRSGVPQIYVMAADGTGQELLVPYDYGVTGASYSPEWSPDGSAIIFHRMVEGSPQLFVYSLAGRQIRQLTSQGRNEDGSWAPDSRHIVFISDRTGRRQLHVIDLETARVRQVPVPGQARLPSWSGLFSGSASTSTP